MLRLGADVEDVDILIFQAPVQVEVLLWDHARITSLRVVCPKLGVAPLRPQVYGTCSVTMMIPLPHRSARKRQPFAYSGSLVDAARLFVTWSDVA